ncbi:endonuclease V [Parapedobacter sp. ISTM3]|uniref:Endonuclease V n=1 Tax=Parapedobacter luteus TaxID=623280 RepID=A0A1T5ALR1_9SPHI|nr:MULTISPECIES: deoxyribonuclease V [Parapedobacter]MBK1441696.1 endonuclease V [Parapedobacter sp. ISTM3]SKB35769.1 Endonuclease V [Parapedobacter luteus]
MENYDTLSIPEATLLQNKLRERVDTSERELSIQWIGGADVSLNLYSTTIYAGIIVLSFPALQPVGWSLVRAETRFPYVPGYLAFREVPALVEAWRRLTLKPDVLVVDGHGIAHPRRLGIAAHFGVETGQPSVGCAKKLLTGNYHEPGLLVGDHSPIMAGVEQIGYAFRSKSKTAPVFVSPGHLVGMENSLQIIRQCIGKYRIPEPTRLAHELVNRFRRGELPEGVG